MVVATGTASGKSLVYQAAIAESAFVSPPAARSPGRRPVRSGSRRRASPLHADASWLRAAGATYAERSERSEPGHRAVHLPDQGAGPGPAAGAERACVSRAWSPPPTTATRHPRLRHGRAATPTSCSPTPRCCTPAILPFHGRWATFLRRLRYVVVDELHVLRGIFGSHAAHVLRRLRRLCARYGSAPTFVFSSATIGDPASWPRTCAACPWLAVTDDGSPGPSGCSPCGTRRCSTPSRAPERRANVEVARLTAALVEGGWRTVAFCRSRRGTEVVAADVRRRLPADRWPAPSAPTAAGYLAAERREIEAELFGGRVQGVVATNALELGVDIGGLDACVLNGFPGTIASMWQQAGRAGRGRGPRSRCWWRATTSSTSG